MNQKSDRIDLYKKVILRGARPDVFAHSWQERADPWTGRTRRQATSDDAEAEGL